MNEQQIKNLEPGRSISDNVVRGLQCRAYDNGRRVFNFYYRTKTGIQRRPLIGDFPSITLTDARRIAKELYIRVARGEDPQGDTNALRAEPSIDELFTIVWDKHWNTERYRNSRWAREVWSQATNHILPAFCNLRPSQITSAQVLDWHETLAKRSVYTANRALEVLSKMFSYAIARALTKGPNPCEHVPHKPERKRVRYATRHELRRILEILSQEEARDPVGVAFIYTLLFTGARPSFIERAKRSDLELVDTPEGVAGILRSHGKGSADSGSPETALFSPYLIGTLQALRLPVPLDGSLFGIKAPNNLWRRVRAEANCPGLWLRDFRRTFATIALSNGVTVGVVGELLNHEDDSTTKRYAKLERGAGFAAVGAVTKVIQGLQQASNAALII